MGQHHGDKLKLWNTQIGYVCLHVCIYVCMWSMRHLPYKSQYTRRRHISDVKSKSFANKVILLLSKLYIVLYMQGANFVSLWVIACSYALASDYVTHACCVRLARWRDPYERSHVIYMPLFVTLYVPCILALRSHVIYMPMWRTSNYHNVFKLYCICEHHDSVTSVLLTSDLYLWSGFEFYARTWRKARLELASLGHANEPAILLNWLGFPFSFTLPWTRAGVKQYSCVESLADWCIRQMCGWRIIGTSGQWERRVRA
jgi:hypothetical protein